MNVPTKILFLTVRDAAAKLHAVCTAISKHFFNKEAILVVVSSSEAAVYIDQLLWRIPEEGFLPHVIATEPTSERIVITTSKANLNQAKVIFNLCSDPVSDATAYETVYELLDLTHPDKEQLSRKRITLYETAGHRLEINPSIM